jgi:hypothetical protein
MLLFCFNGREPYPPKEIRKAMWTPVEFNVTIYAVQVRCPEYGERSAGDRSENFAILSRKINTGDVQLL